MALKFHCPACDKLLRVKDEAAGRKRRCPRCGTISVVPARAASSGGGTSPEPATRQTPPTPVRPGRQRVRADGLILLSLAWAWVAWVVAYASPWLGLLPPWIGDSVALLVLVATVALIGYNLAFSVRLVGQTGQTLRALPLTCAQLVLFGVLFYQIACHLGAEHYDWDTPPSGWDWLGFSLAHALRATDLLDGIEAYGLKVQAIQHESAVTSVSLIAFHLIVNVFFLGLVLEGFDRGKRALLADGRRVRLARWLLWGVFGVWLAAWLASAFYFRPWLSRDLLIWPVENLVRVVDFTDFMDIFHIRWNQVPQLPWEGTLTFMARVFLGLIMAGLLSAISREVGIRWLGGFGLRRAELEEIRDRHASADMQARAKERLARLDAISLPAVTAAVRRELIGKPTIAAAVGLSVLTVMLCLALPGWDRATAKLTTAATANDDRPALTALAALRRMGSAAAAAVPALDQARQQPDAAARYRLAIIQTLGCMGEAAVDPLARVVLEDNDPENVVHAVRALQEFGPRAAPHLVRAGDSPHNAVREAVQRALGSFGSAAVQTLMDTMTPDRISIHLVLIEEHDPYWRLRTTTNPICREMQRASPDVLNRILSWDVGFPEERRVAAETVSQIVSPAIAGYLLERRLYDSVSEVRQAAAAALGRLGSAAERAVPGLIALLNNPDVNERRIAIEVLGQIGPASIAATRPLVERLVEEDAALREAANDALQLIHPGWPTDERSREAVPFLSERLTNPALWSHAAETLGRLGPLAAAAIPMLIQQLTRLDATQRPVIIETLNQIDKEWSQNTTANQTITTLVPQLAEPDGPVRQRATDVLNLINPAWSRTDAARQAVPALAQTLAGDESQRCLRAVDVLVQIEEPWSQTDAFREALTALAKRLQSSDATGRRTVIDVLSRLGPPAAPAVPALVERVLDDDAALRQQAAAALQRIDPNWASADAVKRHIPTLVLGLIAADKAQVQRAEDLLALIDKDWQKSPAALQAVPTLVQRLTEKPDAAGRQRVVSWLDVLNRAWRQTEAAQQAVPTLIRRLTAEPNSTQREQLASLLSGIAPDWRRSEAGQQALPALIGWLTQGDGSGGLETLQMLESFDKDWPRSEAGKRALPLLIKQLQDTQPKVRERAALALVPFGTDATAAAPDLVQALADKALRPHAAQLLHKFGTATTGSFVSKLGEMFFNHPDSDTRSAAGEVLDWLGPKAEAILPDLIKHVRDKDTGTRHRVMEILGRIGPKAADAVPALIDQLDSGNALERIQALDILGKIGPGASLAVPALIKKLSDKEQFYRMQAASVLGRIGPGAASAVPELRKMASSTELLDKTWAEGAIKQIEK